MVAGRPCRRALAASLNGKAAAWVRFNPVQHGDCMPKSRTGFSLSITATPKTCIAKETSAAGDQCGLLTQARTRPNRRETVLSLRPPRVKPFEKLGDRGSERGVLEILLRQLPAATGTQRGIDMQFEVQTEARLRRGIPHGLKDAEERLSGGPMGRLLLIPQPVSASQGSGQPDTSSPALNGSEHLPGLGPVAVEQQHLQGRGAAGRRSGDGNGLATRMENPQFPVRKQNVRRQPGTIPRAGVVSVNMAAGPRHGALDEFSGARGLPLLPPVHQHIDLNAADGRRHRETDAPPRRQPAAFATRCTGENDAASHGP